jgi:hypothetical protein
MRDDGAVSMFNLMEHGAFCSSLRDTSRKDRMFGGVAVYFMMAL